MIELSAYDLDGHLTPFLGDTIAIQRWRYDERGNQIQEAYFGADRKPTRINGYAVVRSKYDERGHKIELAYFDEAGGPTRSNEQIARWKSEFDGRGHETRRTYFGTDGKPTRHKDGYHGWSAKYDRARTPNRAGLLRHRREADKHQRLRGRPLEVRRAREHHRCRLPR